MIALIYPSSDIFKYRKPITLQLGELEDFDFTKTAEHIYHVLTFLKGCHLIKTEYKSPDEVLDVIMRLIDDLNVNNISECKNIRAELCDGELFSLEVYIGC